MNILVVDDEVSLRRTIRTALESTGHRVAEAATPGASGPTGRRRRSPTWCCSTCGSAASPGWTCWPHCSARRPALGVVVITAYASIDTAVEAMRRGALDYLPKPFTPKQLADLIAKLGRSAEQAQAERTAPNAA